MDALQIRAIEDEIEAYDCLIKAAESWSKQYERDPNTHAKLIKAEAKLQRNIRGFYREMADQQDSFINWYVYQGRVMADDIIDTIIKVEIIDGYADGLMKVMFDPLLTSATTGAQAGESIYKVPLGIDSTDSIMQQLTKKHVASLVGKIVNKDGTIVDNPRKGYSILDKTRNDIIESIKTSLDLGEDQASAAKRINTILKNPSRAELIAQTETVNAYSQGLQEFGKQSGAVGKVWQDVSAVDVCAEYADLGPVEIEHDYDGQGLMGPAAHPRCRCGLRLIFQKEWDTLNK